MRVGRYPLDEYFRRTARIPIAGLNVLFGRLAGADSKPTGQGINPMTDA